MSTEEKKTAVLEVGYWDIRGLGAALRMACVYAKADWSSVSYTAKKTEDGWDKSDWFTREDAKPSILARNPLANLPYVVDGDTVITQSNACLKYLGRKLNLYGINDSEKTKIDQCLCQVLDLRNGMADLFYGDADKWVNGCDALLETGAPRHLKKLNDWLSDNQTMYCASDSPSVVDFHLWEIIDQLEILAKIKGKGSLLEGKDQLKQLYTEMRSLDQLSEYFEGDLYKLPINNKMAHWVGEYKPT